jgi:hypothetical protein
VPSSQRPARCPAYSPDLDYQDVKLKIVQQEGYDAHDFNLFDDRSSQLWRKPYVDGAVRELTSGDSRSQEQMRQAIEQMMLASGTTNPDVRHTSRKAHRARGRVNVEVDIDRKQELLTDIGVDQVPPRPAHITSSRGREAGPRAGGVQQPGAPYPVRAEDSGTRSAPGARARSRHHSGAGHEDGRALACPWEDPAPGPDSPRPACPVFRRSPARSGYGCMQTRK